MASATSSSGTQSCDCTEEMQELLNSEFYKIVKMTDAGPAFIKRRMEELESCKFDVNSIYGGDTTALHVACEFGNLCLVKYLLDPRRHTLQYLIEMIKKKDVRDGDNAVHSAAVGGVVAIIQELAKYVPNFVKDRNKYNRSPLHLALGKGREEMAKYLIQHSEAADLHLRDNTGETPLHFAARNGTRKLLELLEKSIRPHMEVNHTSKAGLTPLHYAAWNGRASAVKWLCAREGISLDEADIVEKNTALHWATQAGHWEVVKILVRAHLTRGTVRMFKKNKHNETVLELMEKYLPSQLLPLLSLFNDEGLLDMKAFPPVVLVKFVMGYGDAQAIQNLEQGLLYAVDKEKVGNRYLKALKTLLGSDSDFICWLAERGSRESALLYTKLKGPDQLKLDDFDHPNVAAALRNAILKGKTEFADVLAKHGMKLENGKGPLLRKWFEDMDRDLTGNLRETATSMFTMLSMKNRKGLTDDKLFKDIPLAFWIFEADTTVSKPIMAQFLENHKAWGLVINQQGQETGRTALHWAYIFRRGQTPGPAPGQSTASKLSEIKECTQSIKDVYGRTSSEYATTYREEERSVYIDALKSILVAAALMASIDFAGFVMAEPIGYASKSVMGVNRSMQIFWICSCLAFFLAMASGLACLGGMLPMSDIDLTGIVIKVETALSMASVLLVLSICSALSAFFSLLFAEAHVPKGTPGGRRYHRYRMKLIITAAVGTLICLLIVLWFFRRLKNVIASPNIVRRLRDAIRCCSPCCWPVKGTAAPAAETPAADGATIWWQSGV